MLETAGANLAPGGLKVLRAAFALLLKKGAA